MKARVIGVAALLVAGLPQDGTEPFRPFAVRPYRLVNSVAFEPDDGTMIVALFHREVLAHRGMRVDSTAPELGLYQTRRLERGWSEPELLPVSGQYSDYEAALTPDGNTLVFNSKRPWPDGRIPDRNDLWLAERGPAGWGAPRPIAALNSFALEESYASLTRDRRIVFVRGPTREGSDDFDLWQSRLRPDGSAEPPSRLPLSTAAGEGDPWIHPDGDYLIFTRWDPVAGWRRTCDLYIAFRAGSGWGPAVPLVEINSTAPDFGPAVSPDGRFLHYWTSTGFMRRPLAPILAAARGRVPTR